MTHSDLMQAALDTLQLQSCYTRTKGGRELLVDAILFGILADRFGQMTRQIPIRVGGVHRRIDFRRGTSSPYQFELVVSSRKSHNNLTGKQNKTEIEKLSRLTRSQAQRRAILLIDLHAKPFTLAQLQHLYSKVKLGRGRFHRGCVHIIYIHSHTCFDFIWRP